MLHHTPSFAFFAFFTPLSTSGLTGTGGIIRDGMASCCLLEGEAVLLLCGDGSIVSLCPLCVLRVSLLARLVLNALPPSSAERRTRLLWCLSMLRAHCASSSGDVCRPGQISARKTHQTQKRMRPACVRCCKRISRAQCVQ